MPSAPVWSVVGSARRVPFALAAATGRRTRACRAPCRSPRSRRRSPMVNSLPGIGSGRRRPDASGAPRAIFVQRRPRTAPGVVADDLGGRDEEGELHALALRVVDLGPVGRHLLAAAPVGDRDAGGAQAPGGPRGVHGHVAAADDDDPPAGEVRRPGRAGPRAGTRRRRGRPGGPRPGRRGSWSAACRSPRGPRRTRRAASAARSRTGLLVTISTPMSVTFLMSLRDHLGRQPVGRDGEAQEAAGLGRRLEDPDAVADAGQLPGGGQAGRAGADDRDPLPVRGRHRHARAVEVLVVPVVGEALEPADRQGALQLAAGALGLARGVAGPPEGARRAASPPAPAGTPSRTRRCGSSET